MADLAREYADAFRHEFAGPVDVIGVSTGGSLALQLAVDHPDVVRRLVVVAAAYRLGARGAAAQLRLAEEVQAGRPRQGAAELISALGTNSASQRALAAVGWLAGRYLFGKATPDMNATIHAEDTLNLRDRLHEISAPTLVIGGAQDGFYSPELFQDTAAGIPEARLILYEGKGHVGTISNRRLAPDVLAFLDG
jgi:pimeloyl-ACP methyl ester carboxylesterase